MARNYCITKKGKFHSQNEQIQLIVHNWHEFNLEDLKVTSIREIPILGSNSNNKWVAINFKYRYKE